MKHNHHQVDALGGILNLISPLQRDTQPVVDSNLIIHSRVGAFGFAKDRDETTLLFARHPDDLENFVNEEGRREFRFKDRIFPVNKHPVFGASGPGWDLQDPREQLDLGWALHEIKELEHKLPRAGLRETCLHRTGETTWESVFVGYKMEPSKEIDGRYSVKVSTKATENYRLFGLNPGQDSTHDAEHPHKLHPIDSFRRAAQKMLKRIFPSEFELSVMDNGVKRSALTRQEAMEAMETHFSLAQEKIWKGIDPVTWKDHHFWPVMRVSESLTRKVHEFGEKAAHDPEYIARGILWGIGQFVMGGVTAPLGWLVDKSTELGAKEKWDKTADWDDELIGQHTRRFNTMSSSAMHRLLICPNPKSQKLKNLRPLSADEHVISFASLPGDLTAANPAWIFHRWLLGHLRTPNDSTFEYRGDKYDLVDPANRKDIRLLQAYASDGVVATYVPSEKTVYAYYHKPSHIVPNRDLPADARDFFMAGHVYRIDGEHPHRLMEMISFRTYENEMRRITNNPALVLPKSDEPECDAVSGRCVIKPPAALDTSRPC